MTDSADGLLDQRHTPSAAEDQSSTDVSRLMPEVASIEDELRRLASDEGDGAPGNDQPPSRLRGADASKAVLAVFASLDDTEAEPGPEPGPESEPERGPEPEPAAPLPDTHHESDPEEEMVEEGGPVLPEHDAAPGPEAPPEEPDTEPLPEPEQLEPPDPAVDPSATLAPQPPVASLPPLSPSTEAILAALHAASAATETASAQHSTGVTTEAVAAAPPPAGTAPAPAPGNEARIEAQDEAQDEARNEAGTGTAVERDASPDDETHPGPASTSEPDESGSATTEPTTAAEVATGAAGTAPGRRKAPRARLWGRRHPAAHPAAHPTDRLRDEPRTATQVPEEPDAPEIPAPDTPDVPGAPETPEPPHASGPIESAETAAPSTPEPAAAPDEHDRLERLIEASAPSYHDRRSPAEIAEALGARPASGPDRLALAQTALAEPSTQEHYFRPRRSGRRLLSLLLTVGLAATVITCWWAISMRSVPSILVAAAVGVVTALIWAMRASDPPTRLRSVGSRLVIERSGTRAQFDLADPHTPAIVHGRPDDSDWSVTFTRRSLPSVVIDRRAVDPAEFMAIFDRYRPQP